MGVLGYDCQFRSAHLLDSNQLLSLSLPAAKDTPRRRRQRLLRFCCGSGKFSSSNSLSQSIMLGFKNRSMVVEVFLDPNRELHNVNMKFPLNVWVRYL
ncbi:hypothetical protein OWV82_005430 [Melia azedarach]|uniref:Uncharacterized protein n=1 Tax=Melia azedarach TaxID=155640 RepID=A0ACC1YSQ1_MELAZ|nr:hypothetical protein OWV82_005430 [Melia azedarach]